MSLDTITEHPEQYIPMQEEVSAMIAIMENWAKLSEAAQDWVVALLRTPACREVVVQ